MTTALLIAASLAFTPGLQVTPGTARVSVPAVDSINRATPVRMAGWNDPWEDSLREKKDPAAKLRPGRGGSKFEQQLDAQDNKETTTLAIVTVGTFAAILVPLFLQLQAL